MPSDDYRATRETIEAAAERIGRIERVMGRLILRMLWLMRVFLGGVALSLLKFCGLKDGFHGF